MHCRTLLGRVRATVKLSAALFHDESSITIRGVQKCNSTSTPCTHTRHTQLVPQISQLFLSVLILIIGRGFLFLCEYLATDFTTYLIFFPSRPQINSLHYLLTSLHLARYLDEIKNKESSLPKG